MLENISKLSRNCFLKAYLSVLLQLISKTISRTLLSICFCSLLCLLSANSTVALSPAAPNGAAPASKVTNLDNGPQLPAPGSSSSPSSPNLIRDVPSPNSRFCSRAQFQHVNQHVNMSLRMDYANHKIFRRQYIFYRLTQFGKLQKSALQLSKGITECNSPESWQVINNSNVSLSMLWDEGVSIVSK